jgi:hypothetical protein
VGAEGALIWATRGDQRKKVGVGEALRRECIEEG